MKWEISSWHHTSNHSTSFKTQFESHILRPIHAKIPSIDTPNIRIYTLLFVMPELKWTIKLEKHTTINMVACSSTPKLCGSYFDGVTRHLLTGKEAIRRERGIQITFDSPLWNISFEKYSLIRRYHESISSITSRKYSETKFLENDSPYSE